jgi:hypothetical protein
VGRHQLQPNIDNILKHPLSQTITLLIAEAGFIVNIIISCGIEHLGKFGHSSPVCLLPDFFKGRFPSSFFELRRDKSIG